MVERVDLETEGVEVERHCGMEGGEGKERGRK